MVRNEFLDTFNLYVDDYSLINVKINSDSLLGRCIKDFVEFKNTGKYILTQKNQIDKCFIGLIDSVKYELGVSKENIINLISTQDMKFKPINDVRIGTTFGELKRLGFSELKCQNGFGCYIELPNNYRLGFEYSITKTSIQDTDSIKYIFKTIK
jgi:hypothetical protein